MPAKSKSRNSKKPEGSPTMVLLVRHGTTKTTGKSLPLPNAELSAKGIKEAETTGGFIFDSYLKDASLSKNSRSKKAGASGEGLVFDTSRPIYASPMLRTRETAQGLASATKQKIKIEKDLRECDFGKWNGKNLNSLRKLKEWEAVRKSPGGFRFPGGESFRELQHRTVAAIDRLVAENPGKIIVAVSHADPIRIALAYYMGTHIDLFQRLNASPASVSRLLFIPGSTDSPLILDVNTTAHLANV